MEQVGKETNGTGSDGKGLDRIERNGMGEDGLRCVGKERIEMGSDSEELRQN